MYRNKSSQLKHQVSSRYYGYAISLTKRICQVFENGGEDW